MVIVQATGQTCNQFWIYSNFIAEAIEYDEKFAIWVPFENIEFYPGLRYCRFIKYPLFNEKIVQKIGLHRYWKFINIFFNNKYTLKLFEFVINKFTYHQFIIADVKTKKSSFKFKHQKLLLNYFEPNNLIKYSVDSVLKNINTDLLIGVHIRRGDYKDFNNGDYYYPISYYVQVLYRLLNILIDKKITFLIVSNENIDKEVFSEFNVVFSNTKSMSEDLYFLSCTNYIIGPASTFSAWASLKNSIPICFIRKNQLELLKLSHFIDIRDIWF